MRLVTRTLLSFLSALGLFLAFPPTSFYYTIFIFLIPLLTAFDKTPGIRQAIYTGMAFGLFHSVSMGYWIVPSLINQYEKTPVMAIVFFVLCVALPLSLIYGGFGFFYKVLQKPKRLFYWFTLPSLWIVMQYMTEVIPILVPWGIAGYAALPLTQFVQIADFAGIYGVTFIIVMFNGMLYRSGDRLYHNRFRTANQSMPVLQNCDGLFAVLLFSTLIVFYGKNQIQYYQTRSLQNKSITVKIVQGNFSQKDRWSSIGFYYRIKKYLELSTRDPQKADLVVWPETVLNATGKMTEQLLYEIIAKVGNTHELITGGIRKKNANSQDVYNTAFHLSKQTGIRWYDKSLLLPYAEHKPFGNLLGDYYNAPSSFIPGTTLPVLQVNNGRVGISICVESLYPWYIRHSVKKGAQFLINISNDTWFGDTAMPRLHLMASQFRAIENRRCIIRASNSGFSGIISSTGAMLNKSDLFKQSVLIGEVELNEERSLYQHYGDWIVFIALFWLTGQLGVMTIQTKKAPSCSDA